MARQSGKFITFNDLRFMINNEGLFLRNNFTDSNYFVRKDALQNAIYADNQPINVYSANNYVTYDKVQTGIFANEPDPINVPYTAGNTSITVIAPNGFTITDNAAWLSFSPTSGLSGQEVTATFTLNTITSTRSATITLTDSSTGQTYVFTLTQAANPGVATTPVLLGYSNVNGGNSCIAGSSTYYIPSGQIFDTATNLYTNSSGTNPAPSGYYSDMSIWRFWSGAAFTSSGFC